MKAKMTAAEILAHQRATADRIAKIYNGFVLAHTVDGETFFMYESGPNFCLLTFKGPKSIKIDRHNSYRTAAHRQKDMDSMIARLQEANAYKNERKQLRSAGHSLKVGDVVYSSWGWEQTNIDFYVVTRVISKTMVELTSCADHRTYTSDMTGTCVPNTEKLTGDVLRVKFDAQNRGTVHGHYTSLLPSVERDGVRVYESRSWTSYA